MDTWDKALSDARGHIAGIAADLLNEVHARALAREAEQADLIVVAALRVLDAYEAVTTLDDPPAPHGTAERSRGPLERP